ncbi:MAG: N-acetylglucosamine-6-phosphate deacetylase [Acidimicrobiales bacterium]
MVDPVSSRPGTMFDESLVPSAKAVVGADSVLSPGVVTIRGGLIESVHHLEEGSPAFDVLAPGFVDLQVNGTGAVDVAVADGPDWATLGQSLLEQGVTTWCPTLVTSPDSDIRRACKRVSLAMAHPQAQSPGDLPAIAGIHLEGPFITVAGAHSLEHIRSSVEGVWVSELDPAVRVVTLAPELPGAEEAIAQLSARGVVVSLGHSACSAEQAHAAADAGARLVTHLGNATGPFHQRRPGLLGAALADERLAVSLIADLEHVHPDLLRIAFAAKGPGRVVLVTDSVATEAGTVGPVVFHRDPGAQRGHTRGAPARLADGTLAGSALSMERAVSNVVSYAGIAVRDAIRAASTTPAELLGLGDRGAIAPGRRADLVGLRWVDDADVAGRSLRVEAVWVGGHLAWVAPRD